MDSKTLQIISYITTDTFGIRNGNYPPNGFYWLMFPISLQSRSVRSNEERSIGIRNQCFFFCFFPLMSYRPTVFIFTHVEDIQFDRSQCSVQLECKLDNLWLSQRGIWHEANYSVIQLLPVQSEYFFLDLKKFKVWCIHTLTPPVGCAVFPSVVSNIRLVSWCSVILLRGSLWISPPSMTVK